MIENQNYLLEHNENSSKAKLIKIIQYSSTGMPNDYIFETLENEKPFAGIEKEFPIPEFLLDLITVTKLKENGDSYTKTEEEQNQIELLLNKMKNCDISKNADRLLEIIDEITKVNMNNEQKIEYNKIINKSLEILVNKKRKIESQN